MIDIEKIRQHPEKFRRAVSAKRIPLDFDHLLTVDQQRRSVNDTVNELRRQRNEISEAIAQGSHEREKLIINSRAVGERLASAEAELQAIEAEFGKLIALVPGLPCEEVPIGDGDHDNVEIRRWRSPARKSFPLKDHIELAAAHGMVDFAGAREIAGSRAYALTGNGALLELAVLRFALDRLLEKGFCPVLPPLLVKEPAMSGTGYFPLGEENAYELEKDKLFLTGTSEVGLVSLHMNRVLEEKDLPLRYAGISPCFRREAGAAGKDTKGLYRVHQFQKVEQIIFCANDENISRKEHHTLLQNAEELVQALELPYRVVAMCTAELGLGQVRKHDIETWMPSRENYGETHSCSSFHDFQSRRLMIRYRDEAGKKHFVHTLNNTAIASPRILIALLENHQREDGSIHIPPALRPYLAGKEKLSPP
jgi:seryl-tRNA synthetase